MPILDPYGRPIPKSPPPSARRLSSSPAAGSYLPMR